MLRTQFIALLRNNLKANRPTAINRNSRTTRWIGLVLLPALQETQVATGKQVGNLDNRPDVKLRVPHRAMPSGGPLRDARTRMAASRHVAQR